VRTVAWAVDTESGRMIVAITVPCGEGGPDA
jgi:hypothetical protein